MWALLEALETFRDFHIAGGVVLWTIGFVTIMMWTMIFERIFYSRFVFPRSMRIAVRQWYSRDERHSWHAHHIRRMLIARVCAEAQFSLPVLRTLVALCPLFGLLGTVTGMIEVFDVMNAFGTANSRSMASGISRATLPTMAGMGAAIYGLFATRLLCRHAARKVEILSERLVLGTPQGAH